MYPQNGGVPGMCFNWKAETGYPVPPAARCQHRDGAGLRAASEGCEEAVLNPLISLESTVSYSCMWSSVCVRVPVCAECLRP